MTELDISAIRLAYEEQSPMCCTCGWASLFYEVDAEYEMVIIRAQRLRSRNHEHPRTPKDRGSRYPDGRLAEMKTFLLILSLTSCLSVRQSDLDAWKGVPVDELTTHPIFSTMHFKKRQLSGGRELHIYTNEAPAEEGEQARGCSNQFVVNIDKGIVESYSPVSFGPTRCMTNCRVRPKSRPCDPGE